MHALERIVQKDDNIVARKIADEVVLVPIRHKLGELECIYTLNEVAAHIWERIDGKRSLKALRDSLLEDFDVGEPQAQDDLITLIDQLKEVGAIQEVA